MSEKVNKEMKDIERYAKLEGKITAREDAHRAGQIIRISERK